VHICELEYILTGQRFGRSTHPNRAAAEQHAITELLRLGENEMDARLAASDARRTCADTRADGYGVSIYEE